MKSKGNTNTIQYRFSSELPVTQCKDSEAAWMYKLMQPNEFAEYAF